MSSPAGTSDNLELMRRMGADSFDPMPPDQYLAPMKYEEAAEIPPSARKLLSWVQNWTIRGRRGGRSEYAQDGRKMLRLTDAAKFFGWSMEFVSKTWAQLEDAGFVLKDAQDRLMLCGTVTPRPKIERAQIDPEELASMSEEEKRCAVLLPKYAWIEFQHLDRPARARAAVEYVHTHEYCQRVIREAIAGARLWTDEYRAAVLKKYGITLRKHEDDQPAAEKVVSIQVSPPVPVELTVQNLETPTPVQTTEPLTVTESYPYETDKVQDRVSKYEEEPPAEEGFTCSDLPTHSQAQEHENPEAPAPEAAEPLEVQNLPVERESTPAAVTPVIALAEELCGPLTPKLRQGFDALAPANHLTPEASARYVMQKWEELRKRNYKLTSAGAFLEFCQRDIKLWINQNHAILTRKTSQEPPPPPPAVMEPPEELPGQPEATETEWTPAQIQEPPAALLANLESQIADMETWLEQHAGGEPFRVIPARNELKKVKARYAAVRDRIEQDFTAALLWMESHPDDDDTRAKMLGLKRLLETKANGAAG